MQPQRENPTRFSGGSVKPTDIWTNIDNWTPRPICKNGMPCHDAAPRGAKTGTQGLKTAFERGALPIEFCEEIARALDEQK